MKQSVIWHLALILCFLVVTSCDNGTQQDVSLGGCVVVRSPLHLLTASSARMCAFLCSQLRPGCIGWSYRTGVCNVSDSVQTVRLTSDSDCQVWTGLRQLGLVAFWPMSNATRTRNVVSDSGHLDLQENMPMQYTDSAVNFTGQFDVNERFNVDNLTSVCLSSFTLSVWIKVVNASRGAMPLLEGTTILKLYLSRLWLYPNSTSIEFTVESPVSQIVSPKSINTASGWTHISAVFNNQTRTSSLFVNGTRMQTGSAAAVRSCVDFGSTVQLGAIDRTIGHNRVFQGLMRCFGVSQRALVESDLAQLLKLC